MAGQAVLDGVQQAIQSFLSAIQEAVDEQTPDSRGEFRVRATWEDGTDLDDEELVLIGPPGSGPSRTVRTSADGTISLPDPGPGRWSLASPLLELRPRADTQPTRARALVGSSPTVAKPTPLVRSSVNELVARTVVCVRCPTCWRAFAVTVQTPSGSAYICPEDGTDWRSMVVALDEAPKTFLEPPSPPQNPTTQPVGLYCRGTDKSVTSSAYGPITVFWDESRFASPNGGDFKLAAISSSGRMESVLIIGRKTWGAAPPRPGGGRKYEWQLTLRDGGKVYTFLIPSNETTPLAQVLAWITIHHTTDDPLNSPETAARLQEKHFADIAGTGPGADIGYHFIIDGNGAIYEGRPLGIKGSHVSNFNGGNVGIVLAGDFERLLQEDPTPPQLDSLRRLVDVLTKRFGIHSVWWHLERSKQVGNQPTECPGRRLIPELQPLRQQFPGPPS